MRHWPSDMRPQVECTRPARRRADLSVISYGVVNVAKKVQSMVPHQVQTASLKVGSFALGDRFTWYLFSDPVSPAGKLQDTGSLFSVSYCASGSYTSHQGTRGAYKVTAPLGHPGTSVFQPIPKIMWGGLTCRPYLSTVRPLSQVICDPLNRAASGKRSKVLVMVCRRSPAAVQLVNDHSQDEHYTAKKEPVTVTA